METTTPIYPIERMREPQLIVATGTKGVGKTYTTCKIIQEYLTPNFKLGKKPRKVLIFDANGEYNNQEIEKHRFRFRTKVLALKDIEEWTKQSRVEVRRILPVDANGNEVGTEKYPEILNVVLHYYRGGMLILEDINKYLVETRDAKIIGALTTNRHRDLDIYIHLQSLAPLTTRMWQNANVVRFHYQMDDIDRYRARIPNYELFKIAQIMVNEKYYSGHERFFCYVMSQLNKIKGEFEKKDFISACRIYLELHPQRVKAVAKKYKKGLDGESTALKECILELYKKYYGNSK
jgi:hypothetical protein